MLAGMGLHPSDSTIVEITNISGKELKNIRVHFIGCSGFDSYETYPDAFASASNPGKNEKIAKNAPVTIRYDKLLPSGEGTWSSAYITYYGENTSNCVPTVEAELADSEPAVGKKVSIAAFEAEYSWETHNKKERIDLFFKIFLSVAVIFMFFQVRGIKKHIDRNV